MTIKISSDQFEVNEAWIICRLHSLETVKDGSIDLYLLLDAASAYIFGHLAVRGETPSSKEVKALFKRARKMKNTWPKKLITTKLDPALKLFEAQATAGGFPIEVVPASYLDSIIKPIQQGMDASLRPEGVAEPVNVADLEDARSLLPDSYDPCTCGSDKKYKFCCKPIFREIVEAMCAHEDGDTKQALQWLEKAKSKVGETAEILCRYAIIYHSESPEKFYEYIDKTLALNPNHPRAHYLLGIEHVANDRLVEAATSYEKAIDCYPKTDKYHLNETWNNLANVYFQVERFSDAKGAWEKALTYMPKDQLTRDNLYQFIYHNDELPMELKQQSEFVGRLLSK